MDSLTSITIIGAGLGGCALGLALSQHNIPTTIYEARSSTAEALASGIGLTPNGVRVLDQLGVFNQIKDCCYKLTHHVIKNDRDETISKTIAADESVYGHGNYRLWRQILLDEMKRMLAERSIPIYYDSKFNGIVSDTSKGVDFLIGNMQYHSSMLIGSDGIFSSVRNHIQPGVVPQHTGLLGVLCHIKRDAVSWPYKQYERSATIQGKSSAIFYFPEDPAAETIMVGVQVKQPIQSREELDNLRSSPDKLVALFQRGYKDRGSTARSIVDAVTENKRLCYLWPLYKIPEMNEWYSSSGRVVIVGDAAHALPPSSGQGVNQALEDAYSLTRLLTSTATRRFDGSSLSSTNELWLDTLKLWHQIRQQKIDEIFDWTTNSVNVIRLPEEERQRLIKEGKFKEDQDNDMDWLYASVLEERIRLWLGREA